MLRYGAHGHLIPRLGGDGAYTFFAPQSQGLFRMFGLNSQYLRQGSQSGQGACKAVAVCDQ